VKKIPYEIEYYGVSHVGKCREVNQDTTVTTALTSTYEGKKVMYQKNKR